MPDPEASGDPFDRSIIDQDPEGGDAGGEIVACGTPEEVAGNPRSFTGHFLRRVLHLPDAAG